MNIKKLLKKAAKEDLQSLETEEDREFCKKFADSVAQQPPKKRRQWLWALSSSVAACAVAAVLIVVLVPFPGGSGDARYEAANFVQTDSSMTELSGALTNVAVNITSDQTVRVHRTYDSVSGDNLFYTLVVDESTENIFFSLEARIIVNDKYIFDGLNITDAYVTETYSAHLIRYRQVIKPDSNTGLNLVQCTAKIESSKYDIYIMNYDEYSLENGTFLTVIDNLFDFQ